MKEVTAPEAVMAPVAVMVLAVAKALAVVTAAAAAARAQAPVAVERMSSTTLPVAAVSRMVVLPKLRRHPRVSTAHHLGTSTIVKAAVYRVTNRLSPRARLARAVGPGSLVFNAARRTSPRILLPLLHLRNPSLEAMAATRSSATVRTNGMRRSARLV